ncbi:hypothetical protein [Lonepinella sp. MS14436]|uniref:hypothetical protein n=1 Tax=Lonepinella sp. MS14436 TaxID=3003619 RepID=UPI0036DCDBDD
MKQLYLALVPTLLLTACSSAAQPLTKDALVGEWICTTEYKHANVGTVDFMTLNADGSLKDDNYILDHILNVLTNKNIDNYFSSPFRYLSINEGTWKLSDDTLTYDLKQKDFKRLITTSIWEDIQKGNELRKLEEKIYHIHSSNKGDEVKLTFNKFIKDGFILSQKINGATYESECLSKNVSNYKYIEVYKNPQLIKEN